MQTIFVETAIKSNFFAIEYGLQKGDQQKIYTYKETRVRYKLSEKEGLSQTGEGEEGKDGVEREEEWQLRKRETLTRC
jgi:hypothetical protein